MTAATLTTKDEVVALRSQNNIKEPIEEKGDEIKALTELRRNNRKEDKKQI